MELSGCRVFNGFTAAKTKTEIYTLEEIMPICTEAATVKVEKRW